MDMKHMLFSTKGRIRRRDYWIWSVATFVLYIAIYVAIAISTGTIDNIGDDEEPLPLLLAQVGLFVPFTWASVCITAKRWHDRGKSAWMYLILIIPVVGLVWTFIECGLLDGTPGPNAYGPSPKARK